MCERMSRIAGQCMYESGITALTCETLFSSQVSACMPLLLESVLNTSKVLNLQF